VVCEDAIKFAIKHLLLKEIRAYHTMVKVGKGWKSEGVQWPRREIGKIFWTSRTHKRKSVDVKPDFGRGKGSVLERRRMQTEKSGLREVERRSQTKYARTPLTFSPARTIINSRHKFFGKNPGEIPYRTKKKLRGGASCFTQGRGGPSTDAWENT